MWLSVFGNGFFDFLLESICGSGCDDGCVDLVFGLFFHGGVELIFKEFIMQFFASPRPEDQPKDVKQADNPNGGIYYDSPFYYWRIWALGVNIINL